MIGFENEVVESRYEGPRFGSGMRDQLIMRIEEVSHFMVKHGCERTGHVNVFAKVQMERLQTTLL